MKKMTTYIIISVIIGLFFSSSPALAEDKPSFNGSATATSKYVWRGYELSKDSLVFFLDGAVSYKGFAAELWVDLDTDYEGTDDIDQKGNIELWETDFILSYSNSIDKISYSFGWIYYDYATLAVGENQEIYASIGYDTILSPTLSVYREIEVGEAYYVSLDLSHSIDLQNNMTMDGGFKAGYMYDEDGDLDGGSYSEFHDGLVWVGLSVPLGDYFTMSPSVNYSFPLTSDSKDLIEAGSFDGNDSNFFWASIELSTSF